MSQTVKGFFCFSEYLQSISHLTNTLLLRTSVLDQSDSEGLLTCRVWDVAVRKEGIKDGSFLSSIERNAKQINIVHV